MPIIKNGKTVTAIYKGNKPIIKIFKGLQLVWEAFKKLLVSGTPPLRLYNSVGENLENYKIDGNSTQEAEPTPSNPKEVKSVSDKTKNLINISDTIISGNKDWTSKDMGDYELPAGTYTLSARYKQIGINQSKISISVRKYGSLSPKYGEVIHSDESGYIINTFTIPEDSKGCRIYFYSNITDNVIDTSCKFYDVQLEVGSTATEYEPYGYKIPVVSRIESLFDINNYRSKTDGASVENNKIMLNGTTEQIAYIVYRISATEYAGKTLTFSYDYTTNISPTPYYNIKFYNSSGTLITKNDGVRQTTASYEVDLETNYIQLEMYSSSSKLDCNVVISNVQLESGNQKTDIITTNIFLDEPLRKIGDYADYIDFENGKVIRNIKEYVFTGAEHLTLRASQPSDGTAIMVQAITSIFDITTHLFCSRFSGYEGYTYGAKVNTCSFVNTSSDSRFHFCIEGVGKTVDEVGAILKEWYENGEPLKLLYIPNAVLQDETIELPNIPTIKGTTIIDVDTEIEPSNMEVIYKGK